MDHPTESSGSKIMGTDGFPPGHFARLVIPTLMLAAFFLVGCLPAGMEILHLHADPALNIEQLEQERIAILPALASSPLMDGKELVLARAQLASELAQSRPTLALVRRARVDSALRKRPHLRPVLQRFARTLVISRDELRELSTATGAVFIVFIVFDEYSFGWGNRAPPEYKFSTAAMVAKLAATDHGLVGQAVSAGITAAIGSAKPGKPDMATLRGHAEARLAGTLSIFNAVEGRAVWVGAAMVNESIDEATDVAADKVWLSARPIPTPPEPAELTPRFFEGLVSRWPS